MSQRMESSPIKNLDGRSSRLEQEVVRRINPDSPTRYDLDFYQRKINRLEAELAQTQDELALARGRLRKAEDFQIKYQLLIKQNQSCLNENERLGTDLLQQKQANENLRQKLEAATRKENEMADRLNTQAKEAEKLRQQNQAIFNSKSNENSSVREAVQLQARKDLERLKAQAKDVQERLANDLRKATREIEQSQDRITFLNAKLEKQGADKDNEIGRVKGEREDLKKKLLQIEQVLAAQVCQLRQSFLSCQKADLESLNSSLNESIEVFTRELKVLSELLEFKGNEVERLVAADLVQKKEHEDRVRGLLREIAVLKSLMEQSEKKSETDLINLRTRLLRAQQESEEKTRVVLAGIRSNYEQDLEQLRLQLAMREAELESREKEHSKKVNKHENDMKSRLERIRDLEGSMKDLEKRNTDEVEQSRLTMTKLETEGQNSLMERASTIQFLEQQIKEQNIQLQHKNNEVGMLVAEAARAQAAHASLLAKLVSSKEAERSGLTLQLSKQKLQVEELELKLHEAQATINQLQNRIESMRVNGESERRTFEYIIQLLKNEQAKLMAFAKDVDRKLLAERNNVGANMAEKNALDIERLGEIEKVKLECERLMTIQRERMKKELEAERNRVRNELAKAQKDKEDLKRAYDEIVGKVGGAAGRQEVVTDYQRKRAVFEAEIGITENLLQVINSVLQVQ